MTAGGVIPPPEERLPRLLVRDDRPPRSPFHQTGEMDLGPSHIVFGTEGQTVVIVTSDDIVLGPEDRDLFTRHLFRAIALAEHTPTPGRPTDAPVT